MQKIDELVHELIVRAKNIGLPMQSLAILAGLHKNTLRGITKAGWSPSTTTIKHLQETIERLEKLSYDELVSLTEKEEIPPPKIPGIPGLKRRKTQKQHVKKTQKAHENVL